MNQEERQAYAQHRIESAYQTLEAARLLANYGYWNSAVNRLYYATFYAINALFVLYSIETQTHSGLKQQFSLHFVKPGLFDKKYGKLLSELYDWRLKGDYDDLITFKSEDVTPLFSLVKDLLDKVENTIAK
jgi:uncharacterized protein (UPF0332 family)